MPNRLKALNVVDFTGGVNLRPEAFQLLENELPVLFNLEVDPRGGLNTRKGWRATGPQITTDPWNPHNAYRHVTATAEWVYVAASGKVYGRSVGAWSVVTPYATADPHMADFAAWGDTVYVTTGRDHASYAVLNGVATEMGVSGYSGGNWQNDYTNPGTVRCFPAAELTCTHAGYMFAANTTENGTRFPNRLRFSHPNKPDAWAFPDYHDINEGGGKITSIMSFNDRLLIFKEDSVWALFGYDDDTWDMTNISRTIGCANNQLAARSEDAVFFLSWPHGIFAYNTARVDEISVQIRTVFHDQKMDPVAIKNAFMGWVGRRLWVSLPYSGEHPLPDDALMVFVFDPVLGSWTMFRGSEDCVPGPYIERIETDASESEVSVNRTFPWLVALDAMPGRAVDECRPGMVMPFQTRLRTRWLDAGAPTWKKSWRRPDFLLRALTVESTVDVRVYHDFDNSNAERSFIVTYSPDNVLAMWGHFKYGDGTRYGGSEQSSSVERGGTMGRAGTVQLEVTGYPGVQWGLNGIIFKYIPRRFR